MNFHDDFPITRKITYLDSACMSLKPKQVMQAMNEYYTEYPGCAGRSAHKIAERVQLRMNESRACLKKFFGSPKDGEIIFTRNTTEAINIISHSFPLKQGDAVLGTNKEHNSNLLPWQLLKKKGVKHETVQFNDEFDYSEFEKKMQDNVKLVSMVHTSNVDGTTIPAEKIIKTAHKHGALVMLDCAQSAPHTEINFKKLDVDFAAVSGHKMLGPTGTGILYGKKEHLEKLEPFMVGGETVKNSTYETADWEKVPHKFEAGLQDYAGIIGFAAAAAYLDRIGMKKVEQNDVKINKTITDLTSNISGLEILGPEDPEKRGGIFSFNVRGADVHQIGLLLSSAHNVMIRTGMHCVHSWFNGRGLKGSARASSYLYNTEEDARKFADSLKKVLSIIR